MSSLDVLIGITAAILLAVTLSKAPLAASKHGRQASAGWSAHALATSGYCRQARTRTLHSWWVASPC
jgi:hypothetical protein